MNSDKSLTKLTFDGVEDVFRYRDIIKERRDALVNIEHKSESVVKAINRWEEYLIMTDLILTDSFMDSAKTIISNGIHVDPELYPEMDIKRLLNKNNLLKIGSDAKQLSIDYDFQENIISRPVVIVEDVNSITVETIKKLFSEKGQDLVVIVEAGKMYGSLVGLNPQKDGLDLIMRTFVEDENFNFVQKMSKLRFTSRWLLKLVEENKNSVIAMLNLKMKLPNLTNLELGELFAFLIEFGFNTNQKENKVGKLRWEEYVRYIDNSFRLVLDKDEILPKREKVEKDRIDGTMIVRDLYQTRDIFNSDKVGKTFLSFVGASKENNKYLDKNGNPIPSLYHRTIEECITFGSFLRREAIAERTRKKYVEGDSGYDKN